MVLKLDILEDLAKGRKISYPNLLAMLLHSALTDHVNWLHQMSGQILSFILGSCNLSVHFMSHMPIGILSQISLIFSFKSPGPITQRSMDRNHSLLP